MRELRPVATRINRGSRPSAYIAVIVAPICILGGVCLVLIAATSSNPAPCPESVSVERPAAKPAAEPPVTELPCEAIEEQAPLAGWTMGEHHLGPFTACAKIDLAFVQRVMPGHDVRIETSEHDESYRFFVVTRNGKPVLTVSPPTEGGSPLQVRIETPAIETPWRIHTGHDLRTLRARHRAIDCVFGAAEGDEGVWCRRGNIGDGWSDGLVYDLDLKPLGKARALVDGETIDLDSIGHLPIAAITWHPTGS